VIATLLGAAALAAAPQASLVASPARVQLDGAGRQVVTVSNHARTAIVVEAARAGFTLDLRGRPHVVAAPRGRWLAITPHRVRIAAGRSARVTVTTRVLRGASPGDHTALLLLSTRPQPRAGLAVRLRLGVVVVLRVPGRVVRRLEPTRVTVRRAGAVRRLALTLANRGNVAETLDRGRLTVAVRRGKRVLARFRPPPRELLPHAQGLVDLPCPSRLRGRLSVDVLVRAATRPGPVLRRTFRIRL